MSELVRTSFDEGVACLVLDSPANRNALSAQLVGELTDGLSAAAGDPSIRAVVLTHTGTVFSAGADLKEQRAEGGPEAGTRRMLGLMQAIVDAPLPVIARVDGAVRAGGLGIVGACDMALASSAASFAFTEVRLGLAPAIISLTTVGRMTPRAVSLYYLTGETFGADAAAQCGLLTSVANDAEALDAALDDVIDALRTCSPQGLAETKPLTTAALRAALADGPAMQALSARLFASDEAREGMLAFLEKRPPRWV